MTVQTIILTYDSETRGLSASTHNLGTTADVCSVRFNFCPVGGDVADIVFCVGMKYLRHDKAENPFVRIVDNYAPIPGAIMSRLQEDEVDIFLRLTHLDGTVESSSRLTMKVVTMGNTPTANDTNGVILIRGSSWEWQSSVLYGQYSVATKGSHLYISIVTDNLGHDPSNSPTYWHEIIGPQGPKGDTGEQGPPGITAIDDGQTSSERTWSSSKISNELSGKQPSGDYATNSALIQGLAAKANTSDLSEVATSGSYDDLSDKPTIPGQLSDLSDDATHRLVTDTEKDTWNGMQPAGSYVTTNTEQSITAKKVFSRTETVQTGGQETIVDVLSTHTTGEITAPMWTGRMKVGNKSKTFLLGVYRPNFANAVPVCGLGAHSWSDSFAEEGPAWEDIFLNPDGNKAVYIGGKDWQANSGWLKVQNSGVTTGGKVYYNKGSTLSPTWKEVAVTDVATTSANGLMSSTDKSALDTLNSNAERASNKVTSVSASSTDTQYPSAKCVYDLVGNVEALLEALR